MTDQSCNIWMATCRKTNPLQSPGNCNCNMWAALGTGKGALLGLNLSRDSFSRDSWAQAINRSFAAMYAGMVINNTSAEVSWNGIGDARANTSERCGKGGCSTLRYDVSYLYIDSTTSESLLCVRLFEVTVTLENPWKNCCKL